MGLSMMNEMLGTLDPKIVYLCIAVFIVAAILALIKKAVVITVIMVVVSIAAYAIVPIAKDFQEQYKISVNDDNQLVMVIEGRETVLTAIGDPDDEEFDAMVDVEIERNKDGEYVLNIIHMSGGVTRVNVPSFMRDTMLKYFKNNSIAYELRE